MWLAVFMAVFAAMNRARGSQFFDLTGSTTAGRLLSTAVMAMTVVFARMPVDYERLWLVFGVDWMLLYGWTILKWDIYWSAAIGNEKDHSKLWGVGMMTLRNTMLLPHYVYIAYLSGDWWHIMAGASILAMGVTYYVSGRLVRGGVVIRNAELANGVIMGAATWMALGL